MRGVRGVLGVPARVGAEEVAEPQVDEPHRRGGAALARRSRQPSGAHSLNTAAGRPVTRSIAVPVGLVLVEPVLGDQSREDARVDAAGHVMPGGDRAERPGVVDEARCPREPGRLGHRGEKAPDGVGGVEEPPRHPDVHARVEPGQRRELARPDRLIDGEGDQVEARVGAEALQQRAQRVGELDADRDVMAGVRPEPLVRGPVMVAPHAGMQRHHQSVVAGHPGHLRQHVPPERHRFPVGGRAGERRAVDPRRLGGLERVGPHVGVAVVG